jgi:D-3-phosphoglycerate dehydrogenase
MFKVLTTVSLPRDLRENLEKIADITDKTVDGSLFKYGGEDFASAVQRADGIILGVPEIITRQMLEQANDLKVIARYGVGLDNIDLDAAFEKGVVVTYTPVLYDAVTELTFGLILSLTRKIPQAIASVKEWRAERFTGVDLLGKTLGLIGLGNIGKRVASVGQSFGMKLVYTDIVRNEQTEKELGIQYLTLDDLLRTSDFVSIHVPLTKDTKNLIGKRELSLMKKQAYIINTARGKIIDESALIEALKNHQIAGAGLDTLAVEPPNVTNPLFELDNAIVTPHIGASTVETGKMKATAAVNDLISVLKGEKPKYPVKYNQK